MGAIREIKQKYFGEGDLEAFFGLFGDVFSKIAAIIGVLYFAEGFPADIVMGKILPGNWRRIYCGFAHLFLGGL